jgi:hypothetical protein
MVVPSQVVHITGSDCYETVYAMGELVTQLGSGYQVIVAFKRDDKLLGATEGMARIIQPGDKAEARRVFNIVRIWGLDVQPPVGSPDRNDSAQYRVWSLCSARVCLGG